MMEVASRTVPVHLRRAGGIGTVLIEPNICNVIPDLLIARWPKKIAPKKRNLTRLEAAVLAVIEREKSISESDLFEQVFLPATAATEVVFRLLRVGAIRKKADTGALVTDPSFILRNCEITAVELKLTRWREALAQAISYKEFANLTYVLLDGSRRPDLRKLKIECVQNNVGLLLQTGLTLRSLLRPRREHSVSAGRFVALQKLLNARTTQLNRISICETQRATLPDDECQCA